MELTEDIVSLLYTEYIKNLQYIINFALTNKNYINIYTKCLYKFIEKYLRLEPILNDRLLKKYSGSLIRRNSNLLAKYFRINEKYFTEHNDEYLNKLGGGLDVSIIGICDAKDRILPNTNIYIRIKTYNYTMMYFYQEKAYDELHVININKFENIKSIFNMDHTDKASYINEISNLKLD